MNRFGSQFKPLTWFLALLLAALVAGCGGGGGSGGAGGVTLGAVLPGAAGTPGAAATNPTVGSASPASGATNVPVSTNTTGVALTGKQLTATFTQAMDPATITPVGTFTLKETVSGTNVPGIVTMNAANTIATFTPTASALLPNTSYTATVTTAAKNAGGTAMPSPISWSFTTGAAGTLSQAPVNLGQAGTFAILSKAAISNVPTSLITGDVGADPITGVAIGVRCADLVLGTIYDTDGAYTGGGAPDVTCRVTSPAFLLTARQNMETAFTDAQGRTPGVGPFLNLGGGTVTSQTLVPGVYTWNVPVTITGDLTLSGTADDVWIFQMTQTLGTDKKILLAGGALAKNVFWQVTGAVTLQATTEFTGVILGATTIQMITGAKINGRLFSQTNIALDQNTITQPAP